MQMKNNILKYFPEKLEKLIEVEIADKFNNLEEIRLRTERPLILKMNEGDIIIKYNVTTEDILSTMQYICENSIYSYQNQIASGFVTVKGGHRVGISGSCVVESGKVININYIYSLNFRVAKEIIGSSNKILDEIIKRDENTIYNTLIVSPPGAGKTTILRDLIRQISSRNKKYKV